MNIRTIKLYKHQSCASKYYRKNLDAIIELRLSFLKITGIILGFKAKDQIKYMRNLKSTHKNKYKDLSSHMP
jgi:hypothetical protein